MSQRSMWAACLAAAVLAAGCGGDDDAALEARPAAAEARTVAIDPDKDPYAITCAELADVSGSAELIQRAQFTLADDAKLKKMSRQQAARSIVYAMTEICKGQEPAATPAQDATEAVRSGKYRAR